GAGGGGGVLQCPGCSAGRPAATSPAHSTINCSHPNIGFVQFIHWYRQFPGRGPAFLVSALQGSKELVDPPGQLSVAANRRFSVLRLDRPRPRDAAVYYCAQEARRWEPGLRPNTNRRTNTPSGTERHRRKHSLTPRSEHQDPTGQLPASVPRQL
uniref:Ig-like domain-containing protein n=1 Tax=Amazona collaria TaxID=241587 RepID=A0A8B9FZT0_9PSIT